MSKIDVTISNELVIPVVEGSTLFEGHPDAQFAIGMLAIGDEVQDSREDEFNAYLRLRANVYAAQTRMISPDQVRNGIETDADDPRSAHIGIFEQTAGRLVRSVASIRVISKTEKDSAKLPIEDFFPEAFADGPAPLGSVEVSRYICRHEIAGVQRNMSTPLFAAALGHIIGNELGPTYAVVEPKGEADLLSKRVPLTRIAKPKYVPEYAADNLGILIDTNAHARVIEAHAPGTMASIRNAAGKFAFFGSHHPQRGVA